MTIGSKLIDHTLLSPNATTKRIEDLCVEAEKYGFCSVCISPCQVEATARCFKGSDVKVCTVVGFPSGTHVTGIKSTETEQTVADGAQEIDMVINVGAVKESDWEYVKSDIATVAEAAGRETLVRVILGACLLADEEIMETCKYARMVGADFVKTSIGFSKARATTKVIALMRRAVGDTMGVRAASGIRTPGTFKAMVAADVNRTGVSTGIKLIGGTQ